MKIFSFEFGKEPIKYELSEYNGKMFFGTMSRSFYPSKSMMTVDRPEDFKNPENGCMYKPIITTKYPSMVDINEFSFNLNIVSADPADGDCDHSDHEDLAIIMIDTDIYRLVNYTIHPDNFREDGPCIYIPKVWSGKTTDAVVMLVSDKLPDQAFAMILVLYNRVIKRYEYFRINKTPDGLSCVDKTNSIGKRNIKAWINYDNVNKKRAARIKEYIPGPCGKFYITKAKYKDELDNLLANYNIPFTPVILSVEDNETDKIKDMIKETFRGKKNVLTWYKLPIVKSDENIIKLNFTMDETGIVRG